MATEAVLIVALARGLLSRVLQDGFAEVKAGPPTAAALRHRRIESRLVGVHLVQGSGFIGAEPSNREC